MNVSSSGGKSRLNLSKRVAFPMQSGAAPISSNVKTTSEGLPLPYSTAKYQPLMNPTLSPAQPTPSSTSATPPPPPPPLAIFNPIQNVSTSAESKQSESSKEPFDSVAAREFCHSIFMRLIDQMDESIDAVKLTETRKRMDVLNDMWIENRFDEVVQHKLYNLGRGEMQYFNKKNINFKILFYNTIISALEKNDVNAAEEEYRFLVTHHINASTQWATALRQIIHSISGIESLSSKNGDPVGLPSNEVNTVQFMDVSTKPVGVDSSPLPPQVPNIPVSAPVLPINHPTDDVASNVENEQSNEPSSSKSKTSRFGRVLHL